MQFVEREDCSGQSRGSDVWRERTEAHLNSGIYVVHGAGTPVRRQAFIHWCGNAKEIGV
jgi:hypothetical protein